MGYFSSKCSREGESLLLPSPQQKIPRDSFHLAYICYFILGVCVGLPWNTFITAIDYFIYLYPGINVNRIFTLIDMLISFFCLILILSRSPRWSSWLLIKAGLVVVGCSLLVVPIMDVVYVRGRRGVLPAYEITVAAAVLATVGKVSFECGVTGSAGELPERYLQASGAGRSAAGSLTEDVHSQILMDWYPIILIACFNVSNLVGMSLPAIYLMRNTNAVVGGAATRLLFYPLFLGCLNGPKFMQTEGPVMALTCLLGLSNGYFGNVLMIIGPKLVPLQHSETAALVVMVFSYSGLTIGSMMAWFWLI